MKTYMCRMKGDATWTPVQSLMSSGAARRFVMGRTKGLGTHVVEVSISTHNPVPRYEVKIKVETTYQVESSQRLGD